MRPSASSQTASMLAILVIVVYTAAAVHTVYGTSWIRAGWRALWTLFVYVSLLIVVGVMMFIGLCLAELKQ